MIDSTSSIISGQPIPSSLAPSPSSRSETRTPQVYGSTSQEDVSTCSSPAWWPHSLQATTESRENIVGSSPHTEVSNPAQEMPHAHVQSFNHISSSPGLEQWPHADLSSHYYPPPPPTSQMPYHPPQEDTPHLPLDFIALPAQTSVNNTTTRHRDARRVASQQPQQQGVSNPPLAHAYHRVREASLPQLEPSPNPQPYPVPSAASAASQQPIPTKQKKEILGGLVAGRTRKIVLGLLVLVAIAVAVGVVVSKNKAEKDSNNNKGDFNASPPGGSTTLPPPSSATSSSITLSVATATSTPTTTTTAPPPPLNTFEIYLQCTKVCSEKKSTCNSECEAGEAYKSCLAECGGTYSCGSKCQFESTCNRSCMDRFVDCIQVC